MRPIHSAIGPGFTRGTPGKNQPFLMKPVEPDALLDTVAQVLEMAARSEEGR
jgi:hypothetical protein